MGETFTREWVVRQILAGRKCEPVKSAGHGQAPVNIALCKYWGKRDRELNLPQNSSLSVALPGLDVAMSVTAAGGDADRVLMNGRMADPAVADRVGRFLDLFRPAGVTFEVDSTARVPPAAGLASSAAAFAALVRALDDLYGWRLEGRELSILARLGSGSACRSVYSGAVIWERGSRADGMDSFARPLQIEWPEFRVGLVMISEQPKFLGSREAMNQTVDTSPLYRAWPATAEEDLGKMVEAMERRDIAQLGELAEANALAMHATMIAARPPVLYWLPDTLAVMQRVWALRRTGVRVYFTIDAGPNVKLLYTERDRERVVTEFGPIVEYRPLPVV